MSSTPLIAIRCPQPLKDRLEYEAKTSGQSLTRLVLDRIESGLPSLPLIERKDFPSLSCVYFVVGSDNKLLYIGQTQDLSKRWGNHHRLGQLLSLDPDCRVAWLETDERLEIESSLIEDLKPELNGTEEGFSTTDKTKISAYLDETDNETLERLAAKYRVSKSQAVIIAIRALAKNESLESFPSPVAVPASGITLEQMRSAVSEAIAQMEAKTAVKLGALEAELEEVKKLELAS